MLDECRAPEKLYFFTRQIALSLSLYISTQLYCSDRCDYVNCDQLSAKNSIIMDFISAEALAWKNFETSTKKIAQSSTGTHKNMKKKTGMREEKRKETEEPNKWPRKKNWWEHLKEHKERIYGEGRPSDDHSERRTGVWLSTTASPTRSNIHLSPTCKHIFRCGFFFFRCRNLFTIRLNSTQTESLHSRHFLHKSTHRIFFLEPNWWLCTERISFKIELHGESQTKKNPKWTKLPAQCLHTLFTIYTHTYYRSGPPYIERILCAH